MQKYRNIVTPLLFVALAICSIILPVQAHASGNDVESIEKLFATYGKSSLVDVISDIRNGKITIEKSNTILDGYGKPNLDYITSKSVLHDLQIMKMSVNDFTVKLDEHASQLAKLKEEEEKNRKSRDLSPSSEPVPLSVELGHKIQLTKEQYDVATSNSEKRRLQKELSILRTAQRRARENEKSKFRVYFPEDKK